MALHTTEVTKRAARPAGGFWPGQIVTDKVTGDMLVVVADWGDRALVSSTASIRPDATLIQRAQWQLPTSDLEVA